ncbi:hypothetical protein EVAR_16147_1 [Eumeta japonica]|uniref:Uncharacterized protein n=1 Tax=Eumeta variegata TaxID=151549 RepID=A0A4C1WAR6_EUMVA|nr:hypothetical protein EVAR_16147_1 [Eumeta japonica]
MNCGVMGNGHCFRYARRDRGPSPPIGSARHYSAVFSLIKCTLSNSKTLFRASLRYMSHKERWQIGNFRVSESDTNKSELARAVNKIVDRNHQAMSNLNSRRPAPMLHEPLRPLLQIPYPYAALRNSALIATESLNRIFKCNMLLDYLGLKL